MRGCQVLRHKLAIVCLGYCYATGIASAQILGVTGADMHFTATADSLDLPVPHGFGIGVIGNGGPATEFHYSVATTNKGQPNFVIVSPSSGIAPAFPGPAASGWIVLNPSIVPYLPAGGYVVNLGFAATGQAPSAGIQVVLELNFPGPAQIQSVVNAATLQPGISPGEIVSIFGAHLGTAPVTAHYNDAGLYPTDLSHQTVPYPFGYGLPHDGVTFNGIAAPLLYYSQNQIDAVVPYGMAGQTSVDVVVTHNGRQSDPFPVTVTSTSPGIFTAGSNVAPQGGILNADGTHSNPAAQGSAITLFATGAGVLRQSVPDGSVLFGGGAICPNSPDSTSCRAKDVGATFYPAAPVSVTIGGQPAPLLYVGPSPGSVSGLLQVNAQVPSGLSSGPQPVVLTAGQNSNSQQSTTVMVQ